MRAIAQSKSASAFLSLSPVVNLIARGAHCWRSGLTARCCRPSVAAGFRSSEMEMWERRRKTKGLRAAEKRRERERRRGRAPRGFSIAPSGQTCVQGDPHRVESGERSCTLLPSVFCSCGVRGRLREHRWRLLMSSQPQAYSFLCPTGLRRSRFRKGRSEHLLQH